MKNHRIWLLFSVVILCLILTAGCDLFTTTASSTGSPSPQTSSTLQQSTTGNQTPLPTSGPSTQSSQTGMVNLPSFADLLSVVENSVVKIDTGSTITNVFGMSIPQQGAGSGWVFSSDGLIVTANHVVAGATSITITTLDGKTYPAQVVAGSTVSDLAVLRISANGLPVIKTGESTNIRAGDWVLAVGNPLGEGIIATQGIISRLGVSVPLSSTQTYTDMIETTAAINPGNSGGPLINLSGQVIGIASLKVSAAGIEGLGYAINIVDALPEIKKLSQ